jgi:hypothetical protein
MLDRAAVELTPCHAVRRFRERDPLANFQQQKL